MPTTSAAASIPRLAWARPPRGASRARFVVRRVLWLVPTLAVALTITFALMHAAPGSPWTVMRADQSAGGGPMVQAATPSMIRALDERYGLDRPWWEQLAQYLGGAARLDFGPSYQFPDATARDVLLRGWPETLTIGVLAFTVAAAGGVGLGLASALRRSSVLDHSVLALTSLGGSVPNLVVAIFLIAGLSVGLHRLTGGQVFLPDSGFGLDAHLILPVITLSLWPVAYLTRLMRASALETLQQPYIETARAKGLRQRHVVMRHVLKNSLLPVITALGPLLVFLVTGSVVTETLFQIPGVGSAFLNAVSARDYPVVMAGTAFYALLFGLASIVVDFLYSIADPRIEPR